MLLTINRSKKNCFNIYKKAEVPIVILVLGVLLLCVILFINSFSIFGSREGKHGNIEEIVNMESCLSYIEQYTFYVNNPSITGYPISEIKNLPIFKKDGKNLIEGDNLICDSEGIKIKYPLSNILQN
jgi:hypothetical protein